MYTYISLQKTFSVDEFLQENRNVASLETMRNDLGVYLKVLRSSMIELINKDYADFVNLSTNLIGLDVSISDIQTPLGQFKEQILLVKLTLNDVMSELKHCLEQRTFLRKQKRSLNNLLHIRNSIIKLESLLTQCDNNPALLERIASEYNLLQFRMSVCLHIEDAHKESCSNIHTRICDEVDNFFRECIKSKNIDLLTRCLHIYITLNKALHVENLYKKEYVAPVMYDIISETNLQQRAEGLNGIYKDILSFVSTNMLELISINKSCNFLLNSLWTEVEMRLETYMSSIFAPGNPDMFYEKYMFTTQFLETLESYFKDEMSIKQFRQHEQYKKFQQRWNLPVYFQIRFQEIGGCMETCCADLNIVKINNKLLQTLTLLECIDKCWMNGVFLKQISHKFWKLTLQLISRYCTWIKDATSSIIKSNEDNKVDKYILLYTDISTLVLKDIPDVLNKAQVHFDVKHLHLLTTSIEDSKISLQQCLPRIKDEIIKEICDESIGYIKHVNDIPRLFRKTNRETPNKACSYINSILDIPVKFYNSYKQDIVQEVDEWMETIFSTITERYL